MPNDVTPVANDTPAPVVDEQAAYMEGLNKLLSGGEEEAPKEETKPVEGEEETPTEEEADEAEPEEDAVEDEEEDSEEEDSETPKVAEDALRKLQKEKRTFERHKSAVLEQERAVVAREEQVSKAEKDLRVFIDSLNVDPIETLLQHKFLSEADLDYFARLAFLRSSEGMKNPASKAEAERLRRDRARDAEAKRAMREVENIKAERAAERKAQDEERQLNDYTSRIEATVPVFKAKTPLLTKAMEKDSAATKRELFQIAYELGTANGGRFVEPGKVVLAWEKQQRERLARLGFSTAAAPAAEPSKAKTPTAVKSQGQKTATKPAAAAKEQADSEIAQSEDEYRAELRRRLKPNG